MSRYACIAQHDKPFIHFNEEACFNGAPFNNCLMPTGERGTVSVVFGFDHAVGVFCLIHAVTEDCAPGKDELVVDANSMFHGLSKSHLLQIIEDYVSEDDKAKYQQQITKLALDLPF